MNALPFEVRFAIFLALVVYGASITVAMIRKASRALRLGESYVFAHWDGGLFNGRSAHPRWAFLAALPVGLTTAVLTWGLVTGRWPKPDFVFEIPNGWLDLSSDSPPANYERLPRDLRPRVRAAASGVKRYAIDVDHADFERGGFAAFAAGYVHRDGEVSEASVRELARRTVEDGGAPDARISGIDVRSVGSVRMGRAVIDVDRVGSRLYFYTFARARTFVLLSCTTPPTMAARVEPICDATAEATARRNGR